MFARIICQIIEWEVNYFTAKEKYSPVNTDQYIKDQSTHVPCQPVLIVTS